MIIFDFNAEGGGDSGLIDKIIVKSATIPEAGEDYVGAVYQYVGETGTYTHGYIYECVVEDNTYSWVRIDVQPGISPSGETEQTIQGDLTLASTDGAVGLSFENSTSSTSIGINSDGDLSLASEDGSVIVATPDGTNTNAVVNVSYVNSVVGDIESLLATV